MATEEVGGSLLGKPVRACDQLPHRWNKINVCDVRWASTGGAYISLQIQP
jgi:hypothetical protein